MAVRVRRLDDLVGEGHRAPLVPTVLTLAVLIPVTVFLVAVWVQGWQLQAVESGSMAPTYPVGSLLVVEPIDASQVAPGMAIVFQDPAEPERLVTHRVVGTVPGDELQFWTQGDANPAQDPFPVPARFVRGRVRSQIDGLGFAADWLRWPRSFLLLVALPGVLLLVTEWRARLRPATDVDANPRSEWS
jgi:signal peptidase I